MANLLEHSLSAATEFAIVSKQILEDDMMVGFLYHGEPAFEQDSGWRFLSGAEDDDYADCADNFSAVRLVYVLEQFPEIKPLLNEPFGAWEWDEKTESFVSVKDWQPKD